MNLKIIAITAFLITPSPMHAQVSPPGKIDVRVVAAARDDAPRAAGPMVGIVGAYVEVTKADSPSTVLVARTITDPRGYAHFEHVPEGNYMIKAQLSGYADVSIGPFPVHDRKETNPHISEFWVLLNPVAFSDTIQSAPQPK
jgi:hypothetical protein